MVQFQCVRIDIHLIWSLYLVRTWPLHRLSKHLHHGVLEGSKHLHYGVLEGSSYTWIPSWTGYDCGQISETATHSYTWNCTNITNLMQVNLVGGGPLWP